MKNIFNFTILVALLMIMLVTVSQHITVYKLDPVAHDITISKIYALIALGIVNAILLGGVLTRVYYIVSSIRQRKEFKKLNDMMKEAIDVMTKDDHDRSAKDVRSTSDVLNDLQNKKFEDIFKRKEG